MSALTLDRKQDTTAAAGRPANDAAASDRSILASTSDDTPLVSLGSVGKSFATVSGAVRALDDICLDIRANEFFTLLGPSGCGKTTLLRLLAGFEHPDRGTLLLDGRDVLGDAPNKRPVNIVFQSYALFPHMSVAKNVAFGLERQKRSRPAIDQRVAAMLQLVQLESMASRKPSQLSGGQQQRVALARALAPNPRLLLLDEPLSALDLKLRRGMQVELKRVQHETGITFLLVTHDQEEALSMSDRVAVMTEGRIEQIGTPREVYEAPRSRFVAEFFGANVVPGDIVGSAVPFVAILPERVELRKDNDGQPGRVADATYLGATTTLTIELASGPTIKAQIHCASPPSPGSAVCCRFPMAAVTPLDG